MNLTYPSATVSTPAKKRSLAFALLLFGCLSASLIASLFAKESWLWMDEVLSYILLSDPSLGHMNWAIVGNIDANPPLFFNLYWLLGHGISLSPYFLRATSIILFAGTIAFFYRYATRLVGTPRTNAVIFLVVCSLTYLNYMLSTQIRTYSLYLLIGGVYFIVLHKLICKPGDTYLLVAHVLLGLAMVFVHNFGLFYVAVSFSFVGLLWCWSKQRAYLIVLLSYGLIYGTWLLVWYKNFTVQSTVGQPHSWIPLPTFMSFFQTQGELIPSLSSRLESVSGLQWLPILRVVFVVGLFLSVAVPRLKRGFRAMIRDEAFSFYVLAGYVSFAIVGLVLVVSFGYKSIFLSRYQWPSTLLLLYQFTYAYHHFAPASQRMTRLTWALPLLAVAVTGLMFYQNRKIVQFPKSIVQYLPANPTNDPVFFESADYFLPLQHHQTANAYFLLDRATAISPKTIHNSTNDYNVISSLRDKYNFRGATPVSQFDKAHFPHFYVVDEASRYQIEDFIAQGKVRVIREVPVPIAGHRILECTF